MREDRGLPDPEPPRGAPPEPPRCSLGDTLCRVYVLTDEEWEALPPGRRPEAAEYFPELGWVVAVPGALPGRP